MPPHPPFPTRPGAAVTALIWLGLGAVCVAPVALPKLVAGHGMQLVIAGLTLFIGGIVASFSRRYLRADRRARGFFVRLGALVVAVLAMTLADSLLLLGAAWGLSGWLLAALIGHNADWAEARAAAHRARLSFALGDAALLAALAIVGTHAGSDRVGVALGAVGTLAPALATCAALLLLLAAAVRAALPPFSGWLLASMTAPTPVSALMHAGLVNAGGFLLIRFGALLAQAPAARAVAVALGLVAALHGVGVMMVRPDVKRTLAGSTVSQMGFMVLSCGLGLPGAALWHLVGHGLFKAWLFLGSGSAVGMKPAGTATVLAGRGVLGVAGATLGVALVLRQLGGLDPAALPLLLAGATGLASLPALLGGTIPGRVRLALLVGAALLAGLHAAGLGLAGQVTDSPAPAPLPDWATLALLAGFLGAWAWQQHRLSTGRGLPLPLYVHLVNAGALASPATGDR